MVGKRGQGRQLVGRLRSVPALAGLSDGVLVDLDAHSVEALLPAGRTLCSQDGVVRQGYVLLAGTAAMTLDGRIVATLGAGDLVGVVPIVDGMASPYSVVTLTQVRALVLNPGEFSVMFAHPELAQWTARTIAQRLRLALEAAGAVPAHTDEPVPSW